jgi:hypothetical protein
LTVEEALEYATQEFGEAALRNSRVVRFIVGTSIKGWLAYVALSRVLMVASTGFRQGLAL